MLSRERDGSHRSPADQVSVGDGVTERLNGYLYLYVPSIMPRRVIPRDPRVWRDIDSRLAAGETITSVARDYGVSQQTMSYHAARRREIIEQIRQELLATAPDAADVMRRTIRRGQADDADTPTMSLAYKASADLLRAMGYLPSPTPASLVIHGDVTLSPTVQQILQLSQVDTGPAVAWDTDDTPDPDE